MKEPSRTDINFQREKEEKWKGKRKEGRERGNQGREREKSRNEQGIQGREREK